MSASGGEADMDFAAGYVRLMTHQRHGLLGIFAAQTDGEPHSGGRESLL